MTTNTKETLDINDLEDADMVETPALEIKKNKGMSKSAKIGISIGVVALLAAGAVSMSSGPEPLKPANVNNARITTGDAPPNLASVVPTNPEAAALLKTTEEKRELEAKNDSTKSFATADPFGETKPSTLKAVDDGQVTLNPPPPPPVQTTSNGNNQEDPTLAYARRIYDAATREISPGVGVPVSNNQANTANNTVNNPLLSNNTGSYSQQQQMSVGQDADIPAGIMLYGRLTSTLNSLVPQTPPRAIVVGGPFAGGILMGAMENADNQYLVLRFTTLTLGKKTYSISAIAVNPEAQDAGLADKVTSKAWERAALTAGLGFVQSYGAAKLQEGTTTVQNSGLTGVSSSTQTGTRTNAQTALIALGGAAQSVQATAQNEIQNIKDTVEVNQNKEIGVLFMQPLYIQK